MAIVAGVYAWRPASWWLAGAVFVTAAAYFQQTFQRSLAPGPIGPASTRSVFPLGVTTGIALARVD